MPEACSRSLHEAQALHKPLWFEEIRKGTGLPRIAYSAKSENNQLKC